LARPRSTAKKLGAKRELLTDAATLTEAAGHLLDGPQRWARRAYALDGRGRSVAVDDPRASRFCLAGALLRAEHTLRGVPCLLRTDESPDVDDLLEPILSPEASPALRVALEFLGLFAGFQLQRLGVRFAATDAGERPLPAMLHRSLLLGLHPRARFAHCQAALVASETALRWIAADDGRIAIAISDEAIS
jgi:hypothetical protein